MSYRVAQLVEKIINSFWDKPLMPLLIACIITAETTSLYVLASSMHKLTIPIILFFAVGGFDYFVAIHVVFKCLSLPHQRSLKFINEMRCVMVKNGGRWGRRFMRSCPPVKVSMGDGTFFDRLTPVVIWQFCVDRVINMLLV